jgi:hypothetical protein
MREEGMGSWARLLESPTTVGPREHFAEPLQWVTLLDWLIPLVVEQSEMTVETGPLELRQELLGLVRKAEKRWVHRAMAWELEPD